MNSTITVSVTLGVEVIEEVDHFTSLGSVFDAQGRTEADVKARIGKVVLSSTEEFFYTSNILSLKNKIRIFNSNVRAVILYHSDHNKEDRDLCQELPKKNPWHLVA